MSFTIDTMWGNLKSDGAVHPSSIPASENRRTAQRQPPSGFLVAQKGGDKKEFDSTIIMRGANPVAANPTGLLVSSTSGGHKRTEEPLRSGGEGRPQKHRGPRRYPRSRASGFRPT